MQLLEIAAPAEEDAERLVEQERMLVPLHEHRVQRPVEILARADAGRLDRRERIEHRAGPDRNAGRAQRAREIDDVLGEAAGVRLLGGDDRVRVRTDSCRHAIRPPPPRPSPASGEERRVQAIAQRYSAARSSARTASISSFAFVPSMRAMSS